MLSLLLLILVSNKRGPITEKPSNEQRRNKGKRLVSKGKSKWATEAQKERDKAQWARLVENNSR